MYKAEDGNYNPPANKILGKFVSAIESIDLPSESDFNLNTKDYGFCTIVESANDNTVKTNTII